MFGNKSNSKRPDVKNKQPDVTDEMEQFAIVLVTPIANYDERIQALNTWCYEHKCVPLNFKFEQGGIFAVVKRV